MSDDEVFQELRSICAKILSVDPAVITRDADLREELEADSLDMAELAAATEDRFALVVDLETAKAARTLQDVVMLVRAAG
ncbi:phosphopantetheine-binding protein [Nonomuraea sp. NPDC046802]|uniref:acyl carrier protein n=1 Tax=Nonomuraea sp. NPDC046802 TaxID=3154919 RepID=UPI0033D7E57B